MIVVGPTSITATTPAHAAGAVDVVVTTPGGTGTGTGVYTYVAPPSVTSVSPDAGTVGGGTYVTITGTNFTGATGGDLRRHGRHQCNRGRPHLDHRHDAGACGRAVDVVVTTPGGTGTGTGVYTYAAAPTVTSVSPDAGTIAGGTYVTVTGTNFTGATGSPSAASPRPT